MHGIAAFAFGDSHGNHLAFLADLRLITGSLAYRGHFIDGRAKADACVMIDISRSIFDTG